MQAIIELIFRIIISVLSLTILIISIKNYNTARININLYFIVLFAIVTFASITITIRSYTILPDDIYFGEYLSINIILSIIIIFMPTQFILYLRDLRRFYTFPTITSFFIILNLYLSGIVLYYRIAIIIIGATSFLILIYEAIERKNGTIFSFAFVFMYGLSYFPITLVVGLIFQVFGLSIILIGASGLIDEYVLISDQQKEKIHKIKKTWIAKRVVINE